MWPTPGDGALPPPPSFPPPVSGFIPQAPPPGYGYMMGQRGSGGRSGGSGGSSQGSVSGRPDSAHGNRRVGGMAGGGVARMPMQGDAAGYQWTGGEMAGASPYRTPPPFVGQWDPSMAAVPPAAAMPPWNAGVHGQWNVQMAGMMGGGRAAASIMQQQPHHQDRGSAYWAEPGSDNGGAYHESNAQIEYWNDPRYMQQQQQVHHQAAAAGSFGGVWENPKTGNGTSWQSMQSGNGRDWQGGQNFKNQSSSHVQHSSRNSSQQRGSESANGGGQSEFGGAWSGQEAPAEKAGGSDAWLPLQEGGAFEGTADLFWRDPNPKPRKVQRDMGTAIWGDPGSQKGDAISRWMNPEGAPDNFDWMSPGEGGGGARSAPAPLGWNEPAPAVLERARTESSLQQSILRMAVAKGLLAESVLTRRLGTHSLIELNELLRVMSRYEQLSHEKTRAASAANSSSAMANLDDELQKALADIERLKASIARDSATNDSQNGGTSKLQQWKNGGGVEGLIIATKNCSLAQSTASSDMHAISDWLQTTDISTGNTLKELTDTGAAPLEDLREFVPGKQWPWTEASKVPWSNGGAEGAASEEQRAVQSQALYTAIPHLGVPSAFYRMCATIGPIAGFHLIDHIAYVKWSPEINAVDAVGRLVQQLPQIGGNIQYVTEDFVKGESRKTGNGSSSGQSSHGF